MKNDILRTQSVPKAGNVTHFPINPESNNNSNAPDKMPVRWTYPNGEFSYNKANVEAALQRQFGSTSDDINAVMWILK